MNSDSSKTIISAPGKVLLAGGYLVLDRLYNGLVVATSSRFYSVVQHTQPSSAVALSTTQAEIVVRAGQFPSKQSTWSYLLSLDSSTRALSLAQTNTELAGKNKFIEITLAKVLQLTYEVLLCNLGVENAGIELLKRVRGQTGAMQVVVLADNDFYSQREQTNKTGLGSSAALVTSLVASVLSHLSIITLNSTSSQSSDLELIHALAQVAHCLAQGKVGSGFDVASAVYGTHIYRRFSPSIIEPLMSAPANTISMEGGLLSALDSGKWDQGAEPFRLPRGIRLMLADVDAGTDTPSFVGKVLAWRKENVGAAFDLWTKLSEANTSLGAALTKLASHESDPDYNSTLLSAAQTSIASLFPTTTISTLLLEISSALTTIRKLLRDMSAASEVPIEPPEQTRLLDACSACPGVIGGGVPGAGGYDALFLLVVDAPGPIEAVQEVWEGWAEMSVCPLAARQSDRGLRVETLESVRGLVAALSNPL